MESYLVIDNTTNQDLKLKSVDPGSACANKTVQQYIRNNGIPGTRVFTIRLELDETSAKPKNTNFFLFYAKVRNKMSVLD